MTLGCEGLIKVKRSNGLTMKRKIFITLVSMITVLSLTACSNESKTDSSRSKSAESTERTSTTKSSEKTKETSSIKNTEISSEAAKSKMGNDPNFSLMIEAAQSQIPMIKEQAGNLYKDIVIEEGKDNTIVYNYQFAQNPATKIDADAMKPTVVKGMKPTMDQVKSIFPDAKIQINYLNPDGTEIASFTITQEDTNKIEE